VLRGQRPLPPLHVELEQSCEPPVGAAAHEVLGTLYRRRYASSQE
jgi:hypothetical protein